jgi:PhnB protein
VRFMIIRKADKNTEAGIMPGNDLLEKMTTFHEEMAKAGILRDAAGLKPTSHGFRLTRERGKTTITDGPFTETKELIAGFSMIEVGSKEEALKWIKQWPVEDGDVTLEIRPLFEEADFA